MPRLSIRSRPAPTAGVKKKGSAAKKGGGGASTGGGKAPTKAAKGKAPRGKASHLRPTSANDFSLEEDELEEVKHKNKYDKVESYEYELPDDFDDEEIDEEGAFNEEDNKKYADFFGGRGGGGDGEDDDEDADLDGSEDEAQAGASEGEEDVAAMLDSDEPSPADKDGAADGAADDDDDVLRALDWDEDLAGGEGLGDDEDGEEEEDLDDEDAAQRHRDMLANVLGKPSRAAFGGDNVVSEAYPESEFGLNPAAASGGAQGKLSVSDLLAGLGSSRSKLGTARKALERMAGPNARAASAALAAPLPRSVRERQERKAGYAETSAALGKWYPIIKANREAPTLRFTSARGDVAMPTTTAMLASTFEPENEMEAQVAALLEAAGAHSAHAVQEAEQSLATKVLTLEEAASRRERLARMRSLLFYHELKAKRMKNIKSKEFHRKQTKSDKRRAAKLGLADEGGDAAVEAQRQAAEHQEYERAKERLTLKHKNTSRWARRALKRGLSVLEPGTKAALDEQLALGQALKRKMMNNDGDSSDNGSTGASEDEEGDDAAGVSGRGMSSRAKVAALDILSGADGAAGGLPTKGLFSLPFMARAMERRRQNAQESAQQTLDDLEEEEAQAAEDPDGKYVSAKRAESGQPSTSGRASYGGAPAAAADVEDAGRKRGGALRAGADDLFGGGGFSDPEDADVPDVDDEDRPIRGVDGGTEASAAPRAKAAKRGAPTCAAAQADLDRALANGPGSSLASAGDDDSVPHIRLPPPRTAAAGVISAARSQLFEAPIPLRKVAAAAATAAQPLQPVSLGRESLPFQPRKAFEGALAGYAFKKGPQGMGYYLDAASAAAAGCAAGPGPSSAALAATQTARRGQPAAARAPASMHQAAAAPQRQPAAAVGLEPEVAEAPREVPRGGAPVASVRAAADGSRSDDDEDVELVQDALGRQAQLVRMAFAGDDVEADFAREKAAEVGAELPVVEAASMLPGWGHWADDAKDAKRQKIAQAKVDKLRDDAAKLRRDASLKHVMLSEKWDKKSVRYHASDVPFPFESKEAYDRSLRQPLGPDFNPARAYQSLTRPAVLKATGVVIDPIRFAMPLSQRDKEDAKDAGKGAKAIKKAPKRARRDVVTVAGGLQMSSKR